MTSSPRSTIVRRFTTTIGWLTLVGVIVSGGFFGWRELDRRLGDDEITSTDIEEPGTATAEVRDLTVLYEWSGTLEFDPPIDVSSPKEGTILDIVSTGDELTNGDVIARINSDVVVWLTGEFPAWRTLANGDEGTDVLQLETALTALGFNSDDTVIVDEEFTYATASMVKDWQASLGVDETGHVELGSVVFGGDRTRVSAATVVIGDTVTSGATLVSIGTTERFAFVEAEPGAAVGLTIGDTATVELNDRTQLAGMIDAIQSGADTWTITIGFPDDTEFPPTDLTNVTMHWNDTVAAAALTIPSSALLRRDDGAYVVDVVASDGAMKRVPVSIGTAVGTRVEITAGLNAGDTVIVL
jgi:multidrug efflux pump subunit AcrA (membrane-fusion protein)